MFVSGPYVQPNSFSTREVVNHTISHVMGLKKQLSSNVLRCQKMQHGHSSVILHHLCFVFVLISLLFPPIYLYVVWNRQIFKNVTIKVLFNIKSLSDFLCSLKLGLGPYLVILIECTEGFGTGGVSPVSRPSAQHIVSMAPVPPD